MITRGIVTREGLNGVVSRGIIALRGGGFSPAALFAGGEQGDAWIPEREFCYTLSAGGVFERVTTTGDAVARNTGMVNGINADQLTAAARPIYTEGGGLAWLAFDGVDDEMRTDNVFTIQNPFSFLMGTSVKAAGGQPTSYLAMGSGVDYFKISWRTDFRRLVVSSRLGSSGLEASISLVNFPSDDYTSKAVTTAKFTTGNILVRHNGVQVDNTTQNITDESLSAQPIIIGGSAAPIDFYGAIVVGTETSETQTDNAEQYLTEKSGVTP